MVCAAPGRPPTGYLSLPRRATGILNATHRTTGPGTDSSRFSSSNSKALDDHFPPPPADQTIDASFALLEMVLDAARDHVPAESAEALAALVPAVDPTAQRLIAAELIKYDLAQAIRSGLARRLEFYWPGFGRCLPADQIPFDLLVAERELRQSAGEAVDWDEYRHRFPQAENLTAEFSPREASVSPAANRLPELAIGTQIDDFLLLKLLGQGAFARVYLARQRGMQRLVALKVSLRGSTEPQALSQLDHPNIVRVFDQRVHGDPRLYLLYMEFVPGGTLARCLGDLRQSPRSLWGGAHLLRSIDQSLLEAQQTVPEYSAMRALVERLQWSQTVAWIGMQLAEALDYAHRRGVLHRDVKPANVLLSAEATPKLVDFNVSTRSTSAEGVAYFGGSLAYASPEQLAEAIPCEPDDAPAHDPSLPKPSGPSDLFSLGILLWELWQGERPWTVRSVPATWPDAIREHLRVRRIGVAPRQPARDASEHALEKALRHLLQFHPADRPVSGAEAAARLRLAFHSELARRFSPPRSSFGGILLRIPVWIVAAILIFVPNGIASRFNYVYNEQRIANEYCSVGEGAPARRAPVSVPSPVPSDGAGSQPTAPHSSLPRIAAGDTSASPQHAEDGCPMLDFFYSLATWVNWIVFPLGIALFFRVVLPVETAVRMGRRGSRPAPDSIGRLWNLGVRSAALCATLWTISGCVFAAAMAWRFSERFGWADAFHFFVSLCLSGGVALVYSYFGMSALSLLVYYPAVVERSMRDDGFDARCSRQRKRNHFFLAAAAIIPLTAIGILMFRQTSDVESMKALVLLGVIVTAAGLTVAFVAYQKLNRALDEYALILGSSASSQSADRGPILPTASLRIR